MVAKRLPQGLSSGISADDDAAEPVVDVLDNPVDVEDAQVKEDLDKEEFIRAQQSKLQKKTRTRTRKAQ